MSRAGGSLMLAFALLATGCGGGRLALAPGEHGEIIEAVGWAPIDEADPLGTQRRSLADAEKKAVETVVGVYISAKTRVDQTVGIDERILADVGGYIRRYEILGERREEGFLKTRIKALVLYEKVGDDLKQLGLAKPLPPPGNPRVRVRLRPEKGWGGQAAAGLNKALIARGLMVVGPDDERGEDLLIQGEAEVRPIYDERLGGLRSARARVTLEVRKSRTGEVLAGRSQEASAVDVADEVAQGKALDAAGSMAGDALLKDLATALKSRIGVVVRIAGVKDFDEVRRLADDIRLNPGVDAATLSDFRDGRAELQVTTEALAGDDLAALIVRSKKFRLSAVSATAYAIELRKQ